MCIRDRPDPARLGGRLPLRQACPAGAHRAEAGWLSGRGGASFYDFLTGRRNLEVLALTSNLDLPAAQFDAVLDLVDMREASRRRVRGYSTGMKQRLGIAAAMLADPD